MKEIIVYEEELQELLDTNEKLVEDNDILVEDNKYYKECNIVLIVLSTFLFLVHCFSFIR